MTNEDKLYISTQLARVGQMIGIADCIIKLLIEERVVNYGNKQALIRSSINMQKAQEHFLTILKESSLAKAKTELLSKEAVMRTCNIIDLLSMMDDNRRDQVELFATRLYQQFVNELKDTVQEAVAA